MNANYGLMPAPKSSLRGREKKMAMGERALRSLDDWIRDNRIETSASAGFCATQN
jgi:hypothetical protein